MNEYKQRLSVYLAGAITNQQDDGLSWRKEFKAKYGGEFHVISPEDKWPEMNHLRGTPDWPEAIVTGERRDIQNSNAVIAKIRPLSMGTAIGIVYAYLSGKTVVLFDESCGSSKSEDILSPVLFYHTHGHFSSLEKCISFIRERHNRNVAQSVLTSNGDSQTWDNAEIVSEISATIESLKSSTPKKYDHLEDLDPEKYADAVKMQIEDQLVKGEISATEVDSGLLNNVLGSIFFSNSYRDEIESLARHFIQKQTSTEISRLTKRGNESTQDESDPIILGQVDKLMHDLKGKFGNIKRSAARIAGRKSVSEAYSEDGQTITINVNVGLELLRNAKANLKTNSSGQTALIAEIIEKWESELQDSTVSIYKNVVPNNLLVKFGTIKFDTWLQVFYDNAIEHGHVDGSEQSLYVSCELNENKDVIIEIWNTGKKVTKKFVDGIFDDGLSSVNNEPGWRVGLKSVQRDVVMHLAGTILCSPCYVSDPQRPFEAEPAREGFPRFRIVLPGLGTNSSVKQKILIADDQDADRSDFVSCLSAHFEIIECSTIDDALDVLEEQIDELYGAVLDLDFRDENKRDGVWLCKTIMNMKPDLVVAMASGKNSWSSPDGHWMDLAMEAGAKKTFAKDEYTDAELLGVFK